MKKYLVLLLLSTVLLTSCSLLKSDAERAQSHLNKAIGLDPTILTHVMAKVDTFVIYKDTLRIPGVKELIPVPCDTSAENRLLFENDQLKVTLLGSQRINGKLQRLIAVEKKAQLVPYQVKVPVKMYVPVVVPAKTIVVIDRGFFWWSGLVLWSIVVLWILWIILGGYLIKWFPKR